MSTQRFSTLKIGNSRFTGESETLFKIMHLLQSVEATSYHYDWSAPDSEKKYQYFDTELAIELEAINKQYPTANFYESSDAARQAMDAAKASREAANEEEAGIYINEEEPAPESRLVI